MEVVRESSESIFAACDAAHGRWAKLLGVRVQVHPKLKLHEFVDIYNATQNFIVATEKVGKVNCVKGSLLENVFCTFEQPAAQC
jgi:hypothetical protein